MSEVVEFDDSNKSDNTSAERSTVRVRTRFPGVLGLAGLEAVTSVSSNDERYEELDDDEYPHSTES